MTEHSHAYVRRLALWRRLALLLIDFIVGRYDRLDDDWHQLDLHPHLVGDHWENAFGEDLSGREWPLGSGIHYHGRPAAKDLRP